MMNKNYCFIEKLHLGLAEIANRLPMFYGKIKLLRFIDKFVRQDSKPIRKKVDLVNYLLQTKDLIDFRLFYFGATAQGLLNYLSREIGSNQNVFWDIGANVGSISLPLLSKCSNLTIHAFEPSPPVFERLSQNVNINDYLRERIFIHNMALSNFSAKVDFFVSSEPHNSGVGSLGKMHNNLDTPVQIDCYKGDDLIQEKMFVKPSFIKIDVEGFEYEVIDGIKEFLSSSNNIQIIFEHEPYRVDERQHKYDYVIELLQSLDFSLFRINENGLLREFNQSMLLEHCDFVARKDN